MISLEKRIDKIIFGLKRKGEIKEEETIDINKLIKDIKFSKDNFKVKKKIVKGDRAVYYVESNEEKIILRIINDYLKAKKDIYLIDRKTQIKSLLNELTTNNKKIIKLDINNYYNSIDIENLEKIVFNNDNIYEAEYINILNRYITTAKKEKTIMPGLSPSNILAEILGKKIDKEIKNELIKKDVKFKYFRYVDDILILIKNEKEYNYEDEVIKILNNFSLELNKAKTKVIDLQKSTAFTYLGYEFTYIDSKWKIGISIEKQQKIENKLSSITETYINKIKTEDNLHDVDKWYYENLKYLFYVKVYKGYNGVYYTGFSYNYNEIYNDFIKGDLKSIKNLNCLLCKSYNIRNKIGKPFYQFKKVEKFIKDQKKIIFIDEKRYMNKNKMKKYIELNEKIHGREVEQLSNKKYYDICIEYKKCFK